MAANQSAELSHYNLKRVTSRIPSSLSLSLSLSCCTVSSVAKFALHVRVVFSQLTRNSTNCLIRTPATVPVPVGVGVGAPVGAEARLCWALHNLFVNMKLAPLYLNVATDCSSRRVGRGGKGVVQGQGVLSFLSYMFYTALCALCDYVLNLKSVNLKQLIELRCLPLPQSLPRCNLNSSTSSNCSFCLGVACSCCSSSSCCFFCSLCVVADSVCRLNH